MKFIKIMCFLTVILYAFSGCGKVQQNKENLPSVSNAIFQNEYDKQKLESIKEVANELHIEKQIPIIFGEDGNVRDYVSFTINSVSIERNQIHSLTKEQLKYMMDIHEWVQDDGTIANDIAYISMDISLYSEIAIPELYFTMSKINYKYEDTWNSCDLVYQSDPIYPDKQNQIGITDLPANFNKEMTIGFLANNEILESDTIACVITFKDFGSNSGIDCSQTFKIELNENSDS
ncbi:MAG: hypothetical protein J6A30_03370 [Ruminococcus sp.]|nr:hypothetical protein [Ruminococcus sp.]